jgi:hypothetical protein
MEWVSIDTKKPKLGEKCYCYFVMERLDGSIIKGTRLLFYLKSAIDNRKRWFCDEVSFSDKGRNPWPVTHWMPEPEPPITHYP